MGRHMVTVPSGLTDLVALLDFIRDPDKYGAKVRELQNLIDEANVIVEEEVGAQDIRTARLQASSDRNMAAEELKAARAEADKVRTDAKASIEAIRTSLKVDREALNMEMAEQRKSIEAEKAMLSTWEKGLNARQESVKAESNEAKELYQQATGIKNEFEAKLEKLRAGLSGL